MTTESDAVRAVVSTPSAPAAVGPYSQAIANNGLLFCSGALPLDPESGDMVGDTPAAQTKRCLENLAAVCRAGGTDLTSALRLTVYTTRLEDFGAINDAYAAFFPADPPARVTVGVAALPKGAEVEIDAIVALA
jgi:2-iminobutanoate/2-iminopropanoate deaminase